MRKAAQYGAVALGTALVIAAGIVVPHLLPAGGATTTADGAVPVAVGTDVCGTGWTAGTAGEQAFRITNTSIAGVEVYLQDARTNAVFLDVEGLGAGASDTVHVRLAGGSYAFRCLPADADALTGATVHVTGSTHLVDATPGILPVTRNDLIPPSKTYGDWIESQLPALRADVVALDADVARGDLAAARTDWLTGHLQYEELGAAYGAFGDADTAINGMPASSHTALDDPDLEGFHEIEALLWSGAPAAAIAPHTAALVTAVDGLITDFPTVRIDPLDIGLRSHEILENALQFEATGSSDAGSHTNLATIDANVTGTREALDPIRGLLTSRYPDLDRTVASLTTLQTEVESFHHADGTWTALDALSTTDREHLDADLGDALELLAPVAAICDIRRTS